ncbi:MAG: DUF58 domain-containing protein [Gammaproteobacteria bacterium]|nr:DUF58 domain-containing protein [Gammaproteobacteria bacterium]
MAATGRLLYHNFRLLHRISRWIRHRFTAAGLLILSCIIAAGIFGIDTRASLAYQIFSISFSLLLVSFLFSLLFRANIKCIRKLPEYGTVFLPLKYRVTIENFENKPHLDLLYTDILESKFPSFEDFKNNHDPVDKKRNWFDRKIGYPKLMSMLQRNRGASISWSAVDEIPAKDEKEFIIEITPTRRGYLRFTQSRVARPDPFGLFLSFKSQKYPEKLLILPKTYQVPHINLMGHRKYQQGGLNQASLVGDSQEFMSLRDYQPGDPLRSIHWRSYAKRGEPIVKEFKDEFFVRNGLVLDTFIEDHTSNQFEEAVSLAASFSLSIDDQDSLLDLLFISNEAHHFTTGRSVGQSSNLLEILACVNPSTDPNFHNLSKLVEKNLSEFSGLILIFLGWDEKRQNMVKRFINMNIPVIVFVINEIQTNLDPGPLSDNPQRFIPLVTDEIQDTLDTINWARI